MVYGLGTGRRGRRERGREKTLRRAINSKACSKNFLAVPLLIFPSFKFQKKKRKKKKKNKEKKEKRKRKT